MQDVFSQSSSKLSQDVSVTKIPWAWKDRDNAVFCQKFERHVWKLDEKPSLPYLTNSTSFPEYVPTQIHFAPRHIWGFYPARAAERKLQIWRKTRARGEDLPQKIKVNEQFGPAWKPPNEGHVCAKMRLHSSPFFLLHVSVYSVL